MSKKLAEENQLHHQNHGLKQSQVRLWPLVMTIFFVVSGGAFGIEEVIGSSGPGMALILILVIPLVWALPSALMTAELSSAMPALGGYYVWVKRAMGPCAGFLSGWWTWLNTWVDNAIYPVLFVDYLSSFLNIFGVTALNDHPLLRWGIALFVIWPVVFLNITGTRNAGYISVIFSFFVLIPFVILSGLGLYHLVVHPTPIFEPFIPPGSSLVKSLGLGLSVAMWNYMGWDGISTLGEEVSEPQRTYPKALFRATLVVSLSYLFPVIAGLAISPDWQKWKPGYFPEIAMQVGGVGLAFLMTLGAVFSSVGQFSANLLAASRVPFVLAHDGYLPKSLKSVHPKYGTPWVSILLSSFIYSLLCFASFEDLILVSVILYAGALLLKFLALIFLRFQLPHLERPYKIPGGLPILILICLLPMLILGVTIIGTWSQTSGIALLVPAAAVLSGPVFYPIAKKVFQTKFHEAIVLEVEA